MRIELKRGDTQSIAVMVISGAADPVLGSDVATKKYVDAKIAELLKKPGR